MTLEEAKQYCEDRGIGPKLTRLERQALNEKDFRMFAVAYPGDPAGCSDIVRESVNASMAQRLQVHQLRQVSGL